MKSRRSHNVWLPQPETIMMKLTLMSFRLCCCSLTLSRLDFRGFPPTPNKSVASRHLNSWTVLPSGGDQTANFHGGFSSKRSTVRPPNPNKRTRVICLRLCGRRSSRIQTELQQQMDVEATAVRSGLRVNMLGVMSARGDVSLH